MSSGSYIVPARSRADIEALAVTVRTTLGLQEQAYFPIIAVIEPVLSRLLPDYVFRVGEIAEMGRAEGHTSPDGTYIELREDVYEKACYGDGRARFTAAHELGHLVMHTNIVLMRAPEGQKTPAYCDSEWQANLFAAAILMPDRFF